MARELYIGLMSGTSLDGVDGVLVDLAAGVRLQVLHHFHQPFEESVRQTLFDLNEPGVNELHRACLAANSVAEAYARVVAALLHHTGLHRENVRAIGAHGQTVRHRPGEFDGIGYTCQVLNGALLAERTGLDVICDFRSRDVAAGGQGAPLVPAFHQAVFSVPGKHVAVLNIGGIANLTLLPPGGPVAGFDCGPGNVLLDAWCQQHTGEAFDAAGKWSRSGTLNSGLLTQMLNDDYLKRHRPKSTGRDHFNHGWLQRHLQAGPHLLNPPLPADVQCTLVHFTAKVAAEALQQSMPQVDQLLLCGGGCLNLHLIDCLRNCLPNVKVCTVDQVCQLDPMEVEATAFAWLAQCHLNSSPASLPTVTGAIGSRHLGAKYPGR